MRKIALWFVLFGCIWTSQSLAQTYHFRFTTAMYNWQRFDTDTTTSKHLRLYQLGSLDMNQLFGKRGISLHAYLGYSSDLGETAGNDPQNLLYHFYLDWKNLPGKARLRLGRQRIYAGVGYGTLDGLSLRFKITRRITILGYAGLLAPALNAAKFEKWDDSHMIGGQVVASPHKSFKVSLSYVRRNRLPIRYKLPGRFTQERLTFQSLQNELFGADVRYTGLPRVNIYARLDYDLGFYRIRRADFTANYRLNDKMRFGAQLIHRNPYQNLNSIFSVFTQYGYDEYAMNLHYRFNPSMSISARAGTRVYEGDSGLYFGGGFYWRNQYIGYYHRSGYEGEGDNLVLQSRIPFRGNFELYFGGNVFSYKLNPGYEGDRDLAIAGNLGCTYRPKSWANIDLQVQTLRNQRYDSDIRFFLRATYWYFRR